MNTHYFDSTKQAYDATQCRDDIETGDVLVIESEKVVGLAYTWPVAVTREHGELHSMEPGKDIESLGEFTAEQISAAREMANRFEAHSHQTEVGYTCARATAIEWANANRCPERGVHIQEENGVVRILVNSNGDCSSSMTAPAQVDRYAFQARCELTRSSIEFTSTPIKSRDLNRRQRNALKRVVRWYRESEAYSGVTSVRFDLIDYSGMIYFVLTTRRSDCGKYSPRAILCARRAHIRIGSRGGLKVISAENGMHDEKSHIRRMIGAGK